MDCCHGHRSSHVFQTFRRDHICSSHLIVEFTMSSYKAKSISTAINPSWIAIATGVAIIGVACYLSRVVLLVVVSLASLKPRALLIGLASAIVGVYLVQGMAEKFREKKRMRKPSLVKKLV
ncbi:hypothetical protein LEN26_007446 [Aphanomyces euteiches]|nr:hypothetical protein AeMF1_004174 [Aphanomyces euteiches]KAH9132312.1 hypothetical protein LEN26_007446 [Aphanomyces euteiches]KAH9186191.1 hypothetical protein AeNC1_011835 [Aphanomyces euteiches]